MTRLLALRDRVRARRRALLGTIERATGLPVPVGAGFLVGFALILASSELAYSRMREMQRAARWVAHTHAVIEGLHAVGEAITEAEADVRGHAIAGEAVPAQGVENSVRAAGRRLDHLRGLVADNATQRERVDSLATLLAWRTALLDSSRVAIALPEARRDAVLPTLVAHGQLVGTSLRLVIERAVQSERALLAARSAAEERAVRRADQLLGLGLACAAVVAAICVALTRRAGRRQALAEAERDEAAEQVRLQAEELEMQNEELFSQTDELERQATQLRSTHDYLAAVVEHLGDGLIAFDECGRPTVCNPAARRLLGIATSHEDDGAVEWRSGWLDALRALPLDAVDEPIAQLLRGQDVAPREVVVSTTPEARTVVVTGRHVRDAFGAQLGAILALHDVTERKAAERLKSELVSVVSHELRTPLTSIRGSLGLLEGGAAGALPPRPAPLVTLARRNTDRLVALVNDLLDIEKLEGARLSRRDDPVRLGDAATAGLDAVRGFAEQHRVDVRTTAVDAADDVVVRGDQERIAQVVVNLLSNAVKFSPTGARVELRLTRLPHAVRVAVRDRGPGIAASDLPKLFGKFQQIDSSDARRHGGTGLGLAICKGIVEEHGGTIGVASRPGEGAEFWFELPVAA